VESGPSLSLLRHRVGDEVVATLQRSADQGFLGRMPVDEQIDHALGFVLAAEGALGRSPSSAVDLGTGGGVPGLVLHSCWPTCRLVLMDVNQRRTEFLSAEVGGSSSTPDVEVVRGRAEELARDHRYRYQFDVVTARSFGPPPVTVECGAPFLGPGGVMVVSEPPGEADESRWPDDGLALVGLARLSRMRFDDRFSYQVLMRAEAAPERYPRRVGVPTKRPLF
jgi:16S rRNA (guanine527-N7)-methyltransferase